MARGTVANVPIPQQSATGASKQSTYHATPNQGMAVTAYTNPAAPRVATVPNPDLPTLGDYYRGIAERLGFTFHQWQEQLSDISSQLCERPNQLEGQSALQFNSQHVGCIVGRQSGKTAWAVTRIAAQCMLPERKDIAQMVGLKKIAPQHVIYTAQSRLNATEKWREHAEIIMNSPLVEYVYNVRKQIGSESMTFTNGSVYEPVTPNRTGGRGKSTDLVIVDEALAHQMWLLSVLRPTMAQRHSAAGCLGAQFVVISNAGNDDSELLNHLQDLGHEAVRNGNDKRVWLEWSMEPGSDPLDHETWARTMPTLGQPNGISLDFLVEESESMRLEDFMREYLCVRIPRSEAQLISMELWMEQYRNDVMVTDSMVIAVDVAPSRGRASIVACSAVGEYLPVEVIRSKEGLDWVVDAVQEISSRWGCPVVVDAGGPAGSMIPVLEARGVEIIPIAARDVAHAAANFYDNVMAKRVSHMNDYRLNDAVKGVTKRPVGERWAFDRNGNVDITPLVAASFAMWAIDTGLDGKPAIYS